MAKRTYISTKGVREVQQIIETKYGFYVSLGKIFSLQPFYILPQRKERSKVLNLRFRKHLTDKTRRTLRSHIRNHDTDGFYQLKCISGNCEKCHLSPKFTDNDFNIPDQVKYPLTRMEKEK